MKNLLTLTLSIGLSTFAIQGSMAAEHGGQGVVKEHGGTPVKEHGGASMKEHGGSAVQEHGGTAVKEHGGQEHGGTAVQSEPSAEQIRSAISTHIQQMTQNGTFKIADPETGTERSLQFVRVHDRVGKTGNFYYTCADFTDQNSQEKLDLDFDAERQADGSLKVVNSLIHKVNGQERYTYDANDNRIPLAR